MTRANLCSRWNQHLRTQTRCRLTRTAKRRYLRFKKRDHQQSSNGILHTPVSPHLAHSSSFSPFRSLDPPPSFTSTHFDDGILPTPHFSTRLPSLSSLRRSGSSSFPTRSGPSQQAPSTPVVCHPRPLGRIPFPHLPCPLPSFLHLLLMHLLSSRLFLFLPPLYHPCLRFLRHFTLFFFTFVKSHNVLCHVLS